MNDMQMSILKKRISMISLFLFLMVLLPLQNVMAHQQVLALSSGMLNAGQTMLIDNTADVASMSAALPVCTGRHVVGLKEMACDAVDQCCASCVPACIDNATVVNLLSSLKPDYPRLGVQLFALNLPKEIRPPIL